MGTVIRAQGPVAFRANLIRAQGQPPSATLYRSDYETIAAAVEETVRGRWFLAEFARRSRQADTRLVLDAIARLEHALAEKADGAGLERVRADLVDMADAIARTKTEIAAIKPEGGDASYIGRASRLVDAIVAVTERATSDFSTPRADPGDRLDAARARHRPQYLTASTA